LLLLSSIMVGLGVRARLLIIGAAIR
jgi:hypothetical protein